MLGVCMLEGTTYPVAKLGRLGATFRSVNIYISTVKLRQGECTTRPTAGLRANVDEYG